MAQKTIIINIFDSNVAKNILRTDVLKTLREQEGLKIVLLVPESKKAAYSEEFVSGNVIVDAWPPVFPSKWEQFALFVARNSIPTHAVRQIQEVGIDGSTMKRGRYIFARIFWLFGHAYLWKWTVNKIACLFFKDKIFDKFFKKYQPDLVFSATDYAVNDLRFLKAAKKRGVVSVSMIKSWDNLSSKDPFLIHPNWLIVHNNLIKQEAVEMHHYSEEKIFVSGIPQFDIYTDKSLIISREDFFQRLGLDPRKKLILFACVGSKLMLHEKEMVKMLAEVVNSGQLKYPAQLLVRLHPAFTEDEKEYKKIPNVVVDRPGKFVSSVKVALRDGWEFDQEDFKHLLNTLKWSDVSINCGSTVMIESCILDTPTIVVGFDAIEEPNYWRSAERLPKRDHMIPPIGTGGVCLANNKKELIEMINVYLENPKLDEVGRNKIVEQQCFKLDGKSGERIANFLLGLLRN